MCAASNSFPVPDSPISSTRASERAAHQVGQALIVLPQRRVLHGVA